MNSAKIKRIPYVKEKSFEERLLETSRILEKYPTFIPCVVEKSPTAASDFGSQDKIKYLVPENITFGQFMLIIRRRLQLKPEHALYFFVDKRVLASVSLTLRELYNKYKSPCGFLFFEYATENTFGTTNSILRARC